jgi:pyruvate formate lyase activating enzyme
MTHPAKWWKTEELGVRCLLCPHLCYLKPHETGICRTRLNINKQLVSQAYHHVSTLHTDPIEKKPLFHFLPGSQTLSIATNGCNLRCQNCQNAAISQESPSNFKPEETITPAQIVKLAQKNNCQSIAYTYTEPTVYYELMLDTARLAKEAGIKNIMVSSGYINPQPLKELIPYLDADTIKKMCTWLADNGFSDTPLHFSRFFPSYQLLGVPPTPVKSVEAAAQSAADANINYVYTGNLPINHPETTLCHHCQTPLIKRMGNRLITSRLTSNICPECQQFIPGVFK